MIEVSCNQARRWIREARDRRIPEEQWALLQAHLETCPACRAYQAGFGSIEHNLGRLLGARWQPLVSADPPGELVQALLHHRKVRARARKWAGYAVLGLLAVVLFMGYSYYLRVTAPPSTPTPAAVLIQPTATRAPSIFRGTLAIETHWRGNAEIELLLPGQNGALEWINLTDHPAQDTDPAWSPDGEWLAFLSDRGGKAEVFVINIAGSRLTRLTDAPTVTWRGPLTWSADGQWLALTGVRADTGDSAVYLVPLNGQGARSLAATRGVPGGLLFSPFASLLTFQSADYDGSLLNYDLEQGYFLLPTFDDNAAGRMRTGIGSAFDWSPAVNQTARLAYLAESAPGGEQEPEPVTELRVTRAQGPGANSGYGEPVWAVEKVPGRDVLRGATWSPGRADPFLAYLQASEAQPGCWQLHLHSADPTETVVEINGLCVDTPPDHSSWTGDGKWLALLAHRPTETRPAYYGLQLPGNPFTAGPGSFLIERLEDADPLDTQNPQNPVAPLPQVRPTIQVGAQPLRIQPAPVQQRQASGQAGDPLPVLPGRLVYSTYDSLNNQLVLWLPNSRTRSVLTQEAHQYSCPTWSPDGRQLAYVSDAAGGIRGVQEVFRVDADGQNPIQLTLPMVPVGSENATQLYGCPAWSPDGQRLAAVLHTNEQARLAIIPGPPEHWSDAPPPTYLELGRASALPNLLWNPDGRQLLVAERADGSNRARIRAVNFVDPPPRINTLILSDGWDDVYGMAFSPDGSRLAYITARYNDGRGPTLQLHLANRAGLEWTEPIQLPGSDSGFWLDVNPLHWLPDGRLAFVIRHRADALVKTDLYLLDPAKPLDQQPYLGLPDLVFDLAFPPGRSDWLVYSSDAGLFALDVRAVQAGSPTAPLLVNKDRAYELDWR